MLDGFCDTKEHLKAIDERWILDASNWRLIAPNREALKLTATEFAFLTPLCQQQGEVCRREELVEGLDLHPDSGPPVWA